MKKAGYSYIVLTELVEIRQPILDRAEELGYDDGLQGRWALFMSPQGK
jgi:hypothetical protein